MRCPKCGSLRSAVVETRGDGESIRRRRECEDCTYRYTTFERMELSFPMVVKKDGRREQYDRAKLRGGLVRACEKTPVSMDSIDQVVEEIESNIAELCVKEIASVKIGDFLMEALKRLDQVAYVRFASVYREFRDVSQFVDTLQSLSPRGAAKPPRGARELGRSVNKKRVVTKSV